jgi:putative membrane protein insertion efficiency factor
MTPSPVRFLARLPGLAVVALIRLYQRTLSPVLPVVTLGRCACRFSPTCSHYAIEAVSTHGVIRGIALALWRLARCTPLTAGGFDPVPARAQPRCTRVTLPSLS